jgi:hypothetical protein
MIYERILPLTPISAPTVVRIGTSSISPSATRAKPEYALRTVITTGMSAPPIAAVVVKPFAKLSKVEAPRNPAAIIGVAGAAERNPAMQAPFAPRRPILVRCFALGNRTKDLDDIWPDNFINATIDPVNVTPPIKCSLSLR